MRLVKLDPSTAYLSNWLYVPKRFTSLESVKGALSFQVTDSYAQESQRFVYLWKETEHHIAVPRSFWDISAFPFRVVDIRPQHYPYAGITSKIKLDHRWQTVGGAKQLVPTGDDVQKHSLDALLKSTGGILQLACGRGKTCVALELAAQSKVPTLIVLPDTQLLEQWTNEIAALLDVPGGVGLIQGAKNDWKKSVVLSTYHTLGARSPTLPNEVLRWFGLIIWDEGHHVPAPTFAASAEAFYGKRVSLTATPDRDDGLHVISRYHIGPVVYKNLMPVQKPRIFFKWTGLSIDETRPGVDIRDINGEIHGAKVSSYNAKWPERRTDILNDAAYAVSCGRKVLVLSPSVAEIINMAAMWTAGSIGYQPSVPLYTDIAIPTPADVGESTMPVELDPADLSKIEHTAKKINDKLLIHPNDPTLLATAQSLGQQIKQHEVHQKIVAELDRRQKAYVKELCTRLTNCGIMVHQVPPKERKRYIDTMPIVFAIVKYGKEGLDAADLDTVLISSVFSSRNGLQQVMGRPTRAHATKKSPVIVVYEDDVGHVIGMCKKLKKHLREWPHEDGGPYDFEVLGHPQTLARRGTWQQNLDKIFRA